MKEQKPYEYDMSYQKMRSYFWAAEVEMARAILQREQEQER